MRQTKETKERRRIAKQESKSNKTRCDWPLSCWTPVAQDEITRDGINPHSLHNHQRHLFLLYLYLSIHLSTITILSPFLLCYYCLSTFYFYFYFLYLISHLFVSKSREMTSISLHVTTTTH